MKLVLWRLFLVSSLYLCYSDACDNEQAGNHPSAHSDHYLCRMCGLSLEDSSSFVKVASPFSISQRNETVVAKREGGIATTTVAVQRLKNPAGVEFDVVTVKESSCKGVGQWESDATWFPGFSWKACVCSQCGRHLGWMFEDSSAVKGALPARPSSTGFYGLIRTNLLTESVAETLTYVPKIFRE